MKVGQFKRWLALIVIYVCRIFPIKQNKILMFSYYGAQYGCNPKYISEYIIGNSQPNTYDIVWAFTDPSMIGANGSIRKVKIMSLRYFYELCTAKVIITNFRATEFFVKRKNQYYIQTWHSSLRLKQIEKDAVDVLPESYIEMAKKDSAKCDLLLSGCQFSSEIFRRAFWYDGEIFEHGTPRNDLFFRDSADLREIVLRKLNIPSDKKILLYAPTFRKDNNLEVYDLDYLELRKTLRDKFGGDWVVLVKFHPHLISESGKLFGNDNVIDVTAYNDIQELLVVTDVLISDYSSLIFDYAITKRPCFLYVPDVEEYVTKERDLYFELDDLPFISVKSQEQLMLEMEKFQLKKYQEKMNLFLEDIGSYENGTASEKLMKQIEEVCFDDGRDEVYEAV